VITAHAVSFHSGSAGCNFNQFFAVSQFKSHVKISHLIDYIFPHNHVIDHLLRVCDPSLSFIVRRDVGIPIHEVRLPARNTKGALDCGKIQAEIKPQAGGLVWLQGLRKRHVKVDALLTPIGDGVTICIA